MKRSFFQAAIVSILLYGCTTWTLKKRLENKLDGNYTRMLRAILNRSWQQYPTRRQLYGHLPPITKTIQARRTRHAGHCWRSKDEIVSDVLLWTPHMANQKQDDQLEHSYSSYVMIRDVTLKTCRRRWMIGRRWERGSGISVLTARHDDDDDNVYKTLFVKLSYNWNFFYCSDLKSKWRRLHSWTTFIEKSITLNWFLYVYTSSRHINGLVSFGGFYSISTFVVYLTPNPFLCK